MLTKAQTLLRDASAALPCEMETHGDPTLLAQPRRALLVSRAERAPTPDSPWILATRRAAATCAAAGEAIVVGAGRTAWDCALRASAVCDGAAIVVCEHRAQLLEYAEFVPARHLLVAPTPATVSKSKAARWLCRDRLIGLLADRAALILLKAGGNMSRVLIELQARGCECIDYQNVIPKSSTPRATKPTPAASNEIEIDAALSGMLAHYTRAPRHGQWPDESRAHYIQWLCSGERFEPRDDFNTLRRILAGRTLIGSGELIPGAVPALCFTAQTVAQIRAQRRWRRGLTRGSFSSYGLAFEKSFLESRGARAVSYVDDTRAAPSPFAQRRSTAAGTWSDEKEWRLLGNLDFSAVATNRIVALCATEPEAASLRAEFGVKAMAIG